LPLQHAGAGGSGRQVRSPHRLRAPIIALECAARSGCARCRLQGRNGTGEAWFPPPLFTRDSTQSEIPNNVRKSDPSTPSLPVQPLSTTSRRTEGSPGGDFPAAETGLAEPEGVERVPVAAAVHIHSGRRRSSSRTVRARFRRAVARARSARDGMPAASATSLFRCPCAGLARRLGACIAAVALALRLLLRLRKATEI
jgi:hypothetical protein